MIGDENVTGFASHVLRVADSTYSFVEFRTTVAGTDDDGFLPIGSQGPKALLAEVCEVGDYLGVCRIHGIETIIEASGESR